MSPKPRKARSNSCRHAVCCCCKKDSDSVSGKAETYTDVEVEPAVNYQSRTSTRFQLVGKGVDENQADVEKSRWDQLAASRSLSVAAIKAGRFGQSLIIFPTENKEEDKQEGSCPRNLLTSQEITPINFQQNWPFDTGPSVTPFPFVPLCVPCCPPYLPLLPMAQQWIWQIEFHVWMLSQDRHAGLEKLQEVVGKWGEGNCALSTG